jgi:hypothetical protein
MAARITPSFVSSYAYSVGAHRSCLVDDQAELADGVAIAQEHDVGDRDDDGEWVVGDRSRFDLV